MSFVKEFKEFAIKGNVMDMAVGCDCLLYKRGNII